MILLFKELGLGIAIREVTFINNIYNILYMADGKDLYVFFTDCTLY